MDSSKNKLFENIKPLAERKKRFQDTVLEAVFSLGPEAEAWEVQEQLQKLHGHPAPGDQIYHVLERLVERGLIKKKLLPEPRPRPNSSGFSITPLGEQMLESGIPAKLEFKQTKFDDE